MSQFYSSLFVGHKFPLAHQVIKPRYNKHFFKKLSKNLDKSEHLIQKRAKGSHLLTSDSLRTLVNGSKELLELKETTENQISDDESNQEQTALKVRLDELERRLMPIALAIPNRWSKDVPDNDLVIDNIKSDFLSKQNLFKTLSHTKLSYINNCYSKSVVGPNSHYYYQIGAKLQHGLSEHFMNQLEKKSFIPISGACLARSAIIEASNTNDHKDWSRDPGRVVAARELPTTIHITEASRESLVAFLTTLGHRSNDEPLKIVTNGANYRQGSAWFDSDSSKISQYQTVHAMIQSSSIETYSKQHYSEFRDDLWNLYKDLGLPFRFVHCSLDSMYNNEYDAYRIDVWLPSKQGWIQASRITHYLDYITVRSGMKRGHLMDSTVLDGQAIVAAIIENRQTSDGTFSIPSILQKSMPHLSRDELARYFNISGQPYEGTRSRRHLTNFEQRRHLVKKNYYFSHSRKAWRISSMRVDTLVTAYLLALYVALVDWTEVWRSRVPRRMQRVIYDFIFRPGRRFLWLIFFHDTYEDDLPWDQIDKEWYDMPRQKLLKKIYYSNYPHREPKSAEGDE